jgi:hypothetical protein
MKDPRPIIRVHPGRRPWVLDEVYALLDAVGVPGPPPFARPPSARRPGVNKWKWFIRLRLCQLARFENEHGRPIEVPSWLPIGLAACWDCLVRDRKPQPWH